MIIRIKDVTDYLNSGKTIDNLLNIVHNTSEYVSVGAVTREEFNSWRSVNQYLWQLLLRQKTRGNKRYNDYK